MESLTTNRKQQLRGQSLPADVIQLLQLQVSTQQRLKDTLADNDRCRVAIDWLQHDYHLTFAAFRVQELILQQQELQQTTAATTQTELWTAPQPADKRHTQLQALYGELQHRLHLHRVKLLGVGLYYKDRNRTQALEWEEADDLDARLFSLLASTSERGGGRMARAVTAEDVCLATGLMTLSMDRARDEVQQLQDENGMQRAHVQRLVDDESSYVCSELQQEKERYELLNSQLQQSTSAIMSPFVAAVTTCWQQMPEVSHTHMLGTPLHRHGVQVCRD